MNSDTKSTSPKFASVTGERADLGPRQHRAEVEGGPTKSNPTSVAAAVPDTT
jgi:hypothetical protein